MKISSPPPEIPRRFHKASALLLEAYQYAQQLKRDVWDFAVEIQSLREAGLTNNDFRWLAYKGFVENAREITMPGGDERTFGPTGKPMFSKKSCFVLTERGASFAGQVCDNLGNLMETGENGAPQSDPAEPGIPRWYRDRQELRWGTVIVKQFKVPPRTKR